MMMRKAYNAREIIGIAQKVLTEKQEGRDHQKHLKLDREQC